MNWQIPPVMLAVMSLIMAIMHLGRVLFWRDYSNPMRWIFWVGMCGAYVYTGLSASISQSPVDFSRALVRAMLVLLIFDEGTFLIVAHRQRRRSSNWNYGIKGRRHVK